MGDDFEKKLKSSLDNNHVSDEIKRQLRQRRTAVLEQVESASFEGRLLNWQLPAAGFAAGLLAIGLILHQQQDNELSFGEVFAMPMDDQQMILEMDPADLEEIEFFDWLESQELNGQT